MRKFFQGLSPAKEVIAEVSTYLLYKRLHYVLTLNRIHTRVFFKCEPNSNYYLYDYFYASHSSDANGQMTYYDWSIYNIINSLNLSLNPSRWFFCIRKERKLNCLSVCLCVILTSSRGGLPSDAVPTARHIHPPQRLGRHTLFQTPHQPLPGKMLADGCPLGNVDGTATANFIGTISWLPSGIPPGASLCDT